VKFYSQEGWCPAAARPLPQTLSSIWRKHRLANKRRKRWPKLYDGSGSRSAATGRRRISHALVLVKRCTDRRTRSFDIPVGPLAADTRYRLTGHLCKGSLPTYVV
jgi:hypothetical protein